MTLLRVLVPLASLALLWLLVDVPAAAARLRDAELRWLLAGALVVQLQILLSALRWRLTAARLGHRLGAGQVVREYYVATLLNQVLPGGVAGDAARVFRNRVPEAGRPADGSSGGAPGGADGSFDEARASADGDGGEGDGEGDGEGGGASTARVAQGVVLERLAGQVALVATTLVGIASWPLLIEQAPPRAALLALATALGIALALAALVAVLARVGPPALRRAAAALAPAFRRGWFEDGMWLVQGVLSVAITASYIAVFALAALAVDAPLPLAGLPTVVPLALASMLLPVSIGGWGLREAAAAALWPLVGLAPAAGVAASVVYGLVSLAGALPALAFVVRGGTVRRTSAPEVER